VVVSSPAVHVGVPLLRQLLPHGRLVWGMVQEFASIGNAIRVCFGDVALVTSMMF
jgi:hypothetical protein